MQLAIQERRVTLSVREFAEFRIGPSEFSFTRTGRWRTALGQQWHQELQSQAEAEGREAEFEVTVSGLWRHREWTIALQGRIDQVIHEELGVTLREIKTVNRRLPAPEEELAQMYSGYFNQAAAYVVIGGLQAAWKTQPVRGELVFLDIAEGISQAVMLTDPQSVFERQLEVLHTFLHQRWKTRRRLHRLTFSHPFDELRPGQEDTRRHLEHTENLSPRILFEAPPGFGKTGIVLDFALGRLHDGHFDRVIYLTGKSTGQVQVVKQLQEMLGGNSMLRYFQMRNRSEHAIVSPNHTCDEGFSCRDDLERRWSSAGIAPFVLFDDGPLTTERIRRLGAHHGVCPYEISRSVLPFADLWVGDYNYVFAPANQGLFFDQPGFDANQTLLIVDEAHNLPDRVASNYSCSFSSALVDEVLAQLRFAGVDDPLQQSYAEFAQFVRSVEPSDSLELSLEYDLQSVLERVVQALARLRMDLSLLSTESWNALWQCTDMKKLLEIPEDLGDPKEPIRRLLWAPRSGVLNLTCLSAAPEIASRLKAFGQVILMSATLSPLPYTIHRCGMEEDEWAYLEAHTPWRDRAYTVAVDARVNTTYRKRALYYPETAETIATVCVHTQSPVAVFFPSYTYAQKVGEHLLSMRSDIRLSIQPRIRDLADQQQFISESLHRCDALFLVLGTGFSEGIDVLGGAVTHAIVVGPALPEVNAVQRARMQFLDGRGRRNAFYEVYQVPAMTKINQALGRLVRAPGQAARVLLHCVRFKESAYQALLAPPYRTAAAIHDDRQLQSWLLS